MVDTITKTVKPGGDYTSLAAFESGEQRVLTAADEIARALCGNFVDTDSKIDGWTTDATRHVIVEAEHAHGSNGRLTENAYRVISAGAAIVDNRVDYTRFIGIQSRATASNGRAFYNATGDNALYQDCIGEADAPALTCFQSAGGSTFMTNCVAYAPVAKGTIITTGGNLTAYSCINIGSFDEQTGALVAVNCYAAGRGDPAFDAGVAQSANASDDNTGSSLPNTPLDDTTFRNVSGFDFSPAAGSPLLDFGNDTSGNPFPLDFTDDILQEARVGWSIGAWESKVPILVGRVDEKTLTCNLVDARTI